MENKTIYAVSAISEPNKFIISLTERQTLSKSNKKRNLFSNQS